MFLRCYFTVQNTKVFSELPKYEMKLSILIPDTRISGRRLDTVLVGTEITFFV